MERSDSIDGLSLAFLEVGRKFEKNLSLEGNRKTRCGGLVGFGRSAARDLSLAETLIAVAEEQRQRQMSS